MRTLWQDIRFGARTLAKSPGFSVVAILALALGIGMNAAVFTLANAVFFKGFPFDKADRILYIVMRDTHDADRPSGVSYPDLRDWRAQAKSFTGMSMWSGERVSISDKNGLPESFMAAQVGADCFRLIGQNPARGRSFAPGEDAAGAPPVAILDYGLWERRYGKDPSLIGQTIRINGMPTTVIGVMPAGFAFPFGADVWLPLTPTPDTEKREARNLAVFGRLNDSATLESARAEMETISRNLQTAYPATNAGREAWVRTFSEFYI